MKVLPCCLKVMDSPSAAKFLNLVTGRGIPMPLNQYVSQNAFGSETTDMLDLCLMAET